MEQGIQQPKKKLSDNVKSIFFLFPSWILLLIFFIGPMILTVIFSFSNLALTGTNASQFQFIGFDNFVQMFQDPNFRISIWNTIVFVFFSAVIGQCFLGFLIAFLMREKNTAFRRVIGLIIIAAWVTPEVVVSFCWVAFLGETGTANWLLGLLNIEPIAWLFTFPMISVIIANVWRGTAFSMMVFQSALDDIPKEVEEAAVMDGASRWQIVTKITIPMVKGTIATNLMLVTLQTLGVFTLIYTMTGGGPGVSTATLPVFMYQQAFVSYQLGYGTAISLVLLAIGAIASLIYMKTLKVKV
ncbi:carbohydrate ABC transporter permease [Enterococcus alcedinis]|uniref:Amino acid ABC transporter permease n=1 Tax=Enterococcus alcedinis TaxID=1274384 RepID=A0A917N4P1_9ENTE|nr:sugar ABC transporter permease [Enterococcus alcedinis]MBP2101369.1 multiple sugar transport system permease protein [Enterococcus alcedinis]GGI65239.1 amino acid ABC transporter permease [Enterococcus alcedinis]